RACLAAAEPDREHRPAEQSDDREDRESDPGEHVLVLREVDDPDHEPGRSEQEVAEDERRPDPASSTGPLAHPAASKPDRQQHEAAAGSQNPGDERGPLHPLEYPDPRCADTHTAAEGRSTLRM